MIALPTAKVESEHELQREHSRGHLEKRIVTINAADIYSITNVAVESQNLHRKAHKHFHQFRVERDRHDLTIADCELEVAIGGGVIFMTSPPSSLYMALVVLLIFSWITLM
jgi:hypothetical protein